jgi:hypothetical protein
MIMVRDLAVAGTALLLAALCYFRTLADLAGLAV